VVDRAEIISLITDYQRPSEHENSALHRLATPFIVVVITGTEDYFVQLNERICRKYAVTRNNASDSLANGPTD